MDLILGVRSAAPAEDPDRLQREAALQQQLKKRPGLLPKAMEAYERKLHQAKQGRTRMGQIFAEAMASMDRVYVEKQQREEQQRQQGLPRQANYLPPIEYLVDYMPQVAEFQCCVGRMEVQYRKYQALPIKAHAYADPFYTQRISNGDEVLARMREVIEGFPDKPTSMQRRFLEKCLACMMLLIYGQEAINDPESVLRRNGWDAMNGVLALLTGRKTGKSTVCAMLCIVVMMCIRSAQIIVTSRTLKQAQIILNTVRVLVRVHPLFKKWGFKMGELSNTTTLTFEGPDGSTRQIEASMTLFLLRMIAYKISECGDGTVCFSFLCEARRGEARQGMAIKSGWFYKKTRWYTT